MRLYRSVHRQIAITPKVVDLEGFEPPTSCVQGKRSPPELQAHKLKCAPVICITLVRGPHSTQTFCTASAASSMITAVVPGQSRCRYRTIPVHTPTHVASEEMS